MGAGGTGTIFGTPAMGEEALLPEMVPGMFGGCKGSDHVFLTVVVVWVDVWTWHVPNPHR